MKVSLRASAMFFGVTPETIARKLRYLAKIGRAYMDCLADRNIESAQFDELQSSVVSKCLPVAIPIAVDEKSRRILGLAVVSMPAQHPLIEKSRTRYGERADERSVGVTKVLKKVKQLLARRATITTDRAMHYVQAIAEILPDVFHRRERSRRGRHDAQAELKLVGFDPLFTLNHSAAMCRDRIARMVRKTWCNSKRIDRLEDHMFVWAHFHNEVYLPLRAKQRR